MSRYTDRFAFHTEGMQALSAGACTPSDDDLVDEFSFESCDTCGSSLGGARYAACCILDGETTQLAVCIDCYTYLANGDEPTFN